MHACLSSYTLASNHTVSASSSSLRNKFSVSFIDWKDRGYAYAIQTVVCEYTWWCQDMFEEKMCNLLGINFKHINRMEALVFMSQPDETLFIIVACLCCWILPSPCYLMSPWDKLHNENNVTKIKCLLHAKTARFCVNGYGTYAYGFRIAILF